jgi:hypothetical protein
VVRRVEGVVGLEESKKMGKVYLIGVLSFCFKMQRLVSRREQKICFC